MAVVAMWESTGIEYRVPVAAVEQEIREACRRFDVREVAADPFRWARTLQALEGEGLPMVEFPQSPARMTPATTGVFEAVVNGRLTHSGDPRLARHVGNAVLHADSRGTRLAEGAQAQHPPDRPGGGDGDGPRPCRGAGSTASYDILNSVW